MQIVKEILEDKIDQQTLDKIDFDFLINGKLLRGKIKSHLIRYEISVEQIVEIQYFVAYVEFGGKEEGVVEDWVSGLCEVFGVDKNIGVLCSMFNGSVAYY